jgi:hydroxyacyl-ACP dehydratase HTD2-like protein with hotdog domain
VSTATTTDVRTFDQVAEGDELPPLSYDVTATTVVLGALASRDWRPQHHDYAFATQRNGVQDIFLNSPNQAAWLERFVTDWTGPRGRMGKLGFRMLDSIFPGDTMTFTGTVTSAETDETGCGWVAIDIIVAVGERTCTTAKARIALPTSPDDNPWSRRGENWKP